MRRSALLAAPLALALCVLAAPPAPAAEATDVSSLKLGKVLLGPAVSPESLSGNVVMVEFWGTH